VYRRLKEVNGEKSWKDWTEHKSVKESEIEALWNDSAQKKYHLFWAWLQEALDGQFSRAAAGLAGLWVYCLRGIFPF